MATMVQMRFHTALYPLAAVREAAKAYSELAHVAIERAGPYLRVRFAPKVTEPDVADAFASHVLAVSIRRRRIGE